MTTAFTISHRLKSPMYGGFRGPTLPPPHTHTFATRTKSPQDWGDLGEPHLTQATRARSGESCPWRGRGRVKTEKQTYFHEKSNPLSGSPKP